MHQGQCLCKAVKVSTDHVIDNINVCHCGMCQKWNGGPGFSIDCGHDLTIEGEDNISYFDSSEWAKRAFCKHCGTHLFYYLLTPSTYYVSAALFDNNENAHLNMQIYVDHKPDYYNFAEKTVMLTEQDIFNMINK